MKLLVSLLTALSLATPALAQHADHDHGAEAAAAAPAGPQGTGVVQAVDAKAGTVTIHHGPIAALKWPAMTMTFKATPDLLKDVKKGATVTFTLNAAGDQVLAIK
ncbi:copper-binding protein [Phenylobacterium soli]|uniref:Copper-binding protein n=1 Tax=Phenylobacterium soli TaxID=2170551 RepID=A0A328AHX8_9CAUL|nr:copper-binding protein [Phenylobacterium soli]RAK54151.1 copper-binding protein [Phenylobacterium soli]